MVSTIYDNINQILKTRICVNMCVYIYIYIYMPLPPRSSWHVRARSPGRRGARDRQQALSLSDLVLLPAELPTGKTEYPQESTCRPELLHAAAAERRARKSCKTVPTCTTYLGCICENRRQALESIKLLGKRTVPSGVAEWQPTACLRPIRMVSHAGAGFLCRVMLIGGSPPDTGNSQIVGLAAFCAGP